MEHFIRSIREMHDRNMDSPHLLATVGMVLNYNDPNDTESKKIQEMIRQKPLEMVINEITGITDIELIEKIKENVLRYRK